MKTPWDSQQNLSETLRECRGPQGLSGGTTTVSNDLVTLSFGSLGISELPKEETGRSIEETAAEWFSS